MAESDNRDLALDLCAAKYDFNGLSGRVLTAAGERVDPPRRMGRALWSEDYRRWISLPSVSGDLKDAVRYFEDRLPEWEWSIRRRAGYGDIAHVGRVDENGTDTLVAWRPAPLISLCLLHALGALPSRGF